MKRCPQCNSVFEDNLLYCTHDGTPLKPENFTIPSEFTPTENEEVTVVRREPLKIDLSEIDQPVAAPEFQMQPTAMPAPIVIVKQKRNTGKYLLFLSLGLLLGGGLVLGTLLLAQNYNRRNNPTVAVNSAPNKVNREIKPPTPTPTPAPTPNPEHLVKTSESDDDFNGRVIVSNANIRSSASKNAAPVTLFPKDDRLNIERRANDESPWYFVTCEHGTSGWMHGDTIEFTQEDAF